jgi:chromosome segregation ATPase
MDFEDIKNFLRKIIRYLGSYRLQRVTDEDYLPPIADDGLISPDADSSVTAAEEQSAENNQVVVARARTESLEKLQAGFDKLISKLQDINDHLSHQVSQHEELMNRLDKLPELLKTYPAIIENQKLLTEQLIEQLKMTVLKEQQFVETVSKIPSETSKQTNVLISMDHQLAAAADADVQMAESFNKFNQTLDKLNQKTIEQTEGIEQMNKTFAASDKYFKQIIARQNKRFMWLFIITASICGLAVLILTGIIIYIR